MWFLSNEVWWCAHQTISGTRDWSTQAQTQSPICSPENFVMQLELFCAEETVRTHEQRIASHVQRERIARLLASPGCANRDRQPAVHRIPVTAYGEATRRRLFRFWCLVMSRRWSPCSALS